MTVLLDIGAEDGIVTIRLNDPARRNALSPQMVEELVQELERVSVDPEARCVILTGAGSVFSAGGDPKRMLAPGLYQDMDDAQLRAFYRNGIQRLPRALAALPIPIIAAVNGPAIGAGCDIACFCDLRIAAEGATFASSFVKLGLVPGDGGAWILPRIIGMAHAKQMMMTGLPVDSAAALRMGLISALTAPAELDETAKRLARQILANPPHAVRFAKQLIGDCANLGLEEALARSAEVQAACHKTHDHREAVLAFLEKRPAKYRGA
jgi:enoyl-CoA hydratase/carnithine racemase